MPRKNYEKWRPSDKKRLLNLASFFPLTGEKYTAVELLPGMILKNIYILTLIFLLMKYSLFCFMLPVLLFTFKSEDVVCLSIMYTIVVVHTYICSTTKKILVRLEKAICKETCQCFLEKKCSERPTTNASKVSYFKKTDTTYIQCFRKCILNIAVI